MANHRMFSNRIANSAKFLQMPSESQLLYFHMCLRADDDGIVEAYPLIKLLGTQPDAYKVLGAKGFIKQLNEDQVIVVVDWLEHNKIRADRKVNSIYLHLLPESIKTIAPKPRSDVEDNSKRLGGPSMVSISKVKLSKVNKNIATPTVVAPFVLEEKLQDMESKKGTAVDIIATFIREKSIPIENSAQLSNAISRYVRVAKKLEAYNINKIFEVMDKIKERTEHQKKIKGELNTFDWTLETVFKELTK